MRFRRTVALGMAALMLLAWMCVPAAAAEAAAIAGAQADGGEAVKDAASAEASASQEESTSQEASAPQEAGAPVAVDAPVVVDARKPKLYIVLADCGHALFGASFDKSIVRQCGDENGESLRFAGDALQTLAEADVVVFGYHSDLFNPGSFTSPLPAANARQMFDALLKTPKGDRKSSMLSNALAQLLNRSELDAWVKNYDCTLLVLTGGVENPARGEPNLVGLMQSAKSIREKGIALRVYGLDPSAALRPGAVAAERLISGDCFEGEGYRGFPVAAAPDDAALAESYKNARFEMMKAIAVDLLGGTGVFAQVAAENLSAALGADEAKGAAIVRGAETGAVEIMHLQQLRERLQEGGESAKLGPADEIWLWSDSASAAQPNDGAAGPADEIAERQRQEAALRTIHGEIAEAAADGLDVRSGALSIALPEEYDPEQAPIESSDAEVLRVECVGDELVLTPLRAGQAQLSALGGTMDLTVHDTRMEWSWENGASFRLTRDGLCAMEEAPADDGAATGSEAAGEEEAPAGDGVAAGSEAAGEEEAPAGDGAAAGSEAAGEAEAPAGEDAAAGSEAAGEEEAPAGEDAAAGGEAAGEAEAPADDGAAAGGEAAGEAEAPAGDGAAAGGEAAGEEEAPAEGAELSVSVHEGALCWRVTRLGDAAASAEGRSDTSPEGSLPGLSWTASAEEGGARLTLRGSEIGDYEISCWIAVEAPAGAEETAPPAEAKKEAQAEETSGERLAEETRGFSLHRPLDAADAVQLIAPYFKRQAGQVKRISCDGEAARLEDYELSVEPEGALEVYLGRDGSLLYLEPLERGTATVCLRERGVREPQEMSFKVRVTALTGRAGLWLSIAGAVICLVGLTSAIVIVIGKSKQRNAKGRD